MLARIRVLSVDDRHLPGAEEDTALSNVITALKTAGCDLTCVGTVDDAVAEVDGGNYDVILLDVVRGHNPEDADFVDVLNYVPLHPKRPRVLVLSAFLGSLNADLEAQLQSQAEAVLLKEDWRQAVRLIVAEPGAETTPGDASEVAPWQSGCLLSGESDSHTDSPPGNTTGPASVEIEQDTPVRLTPDLDPAEQSESRRSQHCIIPQENGCTDSELHSARSGTSRPYEAGRQEVPSMDESKQRAITVVIRPWLAYTFLLAFIGTAVALTWQTNSIVNGIAAGHDQTTLMLAEMKDERQLVSDMVGEVKQLVGEVRGLVELARERDEKFLKEFLTESAATRASLDDMRKQLTALMEALEPGRKP